MATRSGKVVRKAKKASVRRASAAKSKRAGAAKARRAKPAAKPKAKATRPAAKAPAPRTVQVDPHRHLRELAQRIVDLTVSNNDEAAFALYADTVESKEASNPPSVGIEAIRQKFAMWRGMASDATFEPRAVAVDGRTNTIVIEWDGKVTLAASGRVVDFPEVAVHEIAGGKIVRERFYYDPALLAQ